MGTTQNLWRNALGGALIGYGFVSFWLFLALDQVWASAAPRTPDPAAGLIFPHNEHSSITYLSAFQATSLELLFSISIPLAFLGIIIAPKKNITWKSWWITWSANWDQDDRKKVLIWGVVGGAIAAPIILFLIGPNFVHWLNAIGVVLNS